MKNTRGHVAFLALTALALAIVFFWSPSDVERVKEAEAADARTAAFERENAGGALSELPPQF